MAFWLKKVISYWLMPLPFCLVLLAAGWVLSRRSRRPGWGRTLSGTALLLLLLFSNRTVSTWLVRPFETRFAPIPELRSGEAIPKELAACRYVVVLGGGHGDTPGLSASNKLSSSALPRLAEAARLLRALPAAGLIVSGPAVGRNPSHASVLAQAAVALGVEPARIRRIEDARDTEDEAHAVAAIAGDGPVALVTSAWHMPRAAALFAKEGVRILPCPTGYTARPNADFRWEDLGWDVESIERSTWAVHEGLGCLWNRLRGSAN